MERQSGRKYFREKLDRMVRELRNEIVAGKWKDEEYLPSEKALAEAYYLSNKSVRRGLDILVQEGLVEKIPRVGNKVIRQSAKVQKPIRLGYYPSLLKQAELRTLVEQFQQRHPNIKVELVELPSANNMSALRQVVSSGEVDLLTLNAAGFGDFVERGELAEFETLEPDPRIYRFLTEAVSHEGQLKLQPFIFSPLILCYNRSHFRKKDVPEPDSSWRWDELFEYAARLNEKKERIGFYFHFPSVNRWPVFLMQSGATFRRDEKGKRKLRDEALREGLKLCQRLIASQNNYPLLLSEHEADAEKLFFNGKVSMIMTTYFSLNSYKQQPSVKYDIAPLPYGNQNKTLLLAIGLAVSSRSKQKEGAKLLLDFLVSYRSQLFIRQNTLSIPSVKLAAEWSGREKMYRPSRFHLYREIIPTFVLNSSLGLSMEELHVIQREARLYWSGLETEDALLDRLERVLD